MKPRNKKQVHILELSRQLCPLTTAQKEWAFRNTVEHYAYRLKSGKTTCMDCGHVWKEVGFGVYRCPECEAKVEIRNTRESVRKDEAYFNVITTIAGYQVIRMFVMSVRMSKGNKAKAFFNEVGQYWIDPKGQKTVIGLRRTMGIYIDSFDFNSPFEIRSDNDAFYHIANEWIYPRIKVTDTLRRNGFKKSTYSIHPVNLFRHLLTNPKAETFIKSGDIEMLRYLCYHPDDVSKYWNSVKIARRNGYKINSPQMWFDYIRMLERMGRDILSPSLITPANLKEAHDMYVEKINRLREKERQEADRKRAEADKAKFLELKGRFFGLSMSDGSIDLHTLDSIDDYYEEGSKQHICVGSSGYYLKADTLVFTATMNGKTIATVEISLDDYSVIQCRAFANQICEYTDRIINLIAANKKIIDQRNKKSVSAA